MLVQWKRWRAISTLRAISMRKKSPPERAAHGFNCEVIDYTSNYLRKHFKLEGQSYATIGESRHLVLLENSAFWASRTPRVGVEVCRSQRILQTDVPDHHPMIRTAAVLDSKIQSAVCCGSYRINARQIINVTILSAAEGQIIWVYGLPDAPL